MRLLSRLFGNDWSGLLVIVVAAIVLIGIAKPSFLSPFNIQILLAAVAVNMVVALAQMIIIAIGQMNLAVGAIGGLAAISFAGHDGGLGCARPARRLAPSSSGSPPACSTATWSPLQASPPSSSRWRHSPSSRASTSASPEAQPFYGVATSVKAFGNTTVLRAHPLAARAYGCRQPRRSLPAQPRPRRPLHPAVGGSPHAAELGGVSVSQSIVWAHAISGLLAAIAGMMVVGRLQIGQPTIGDDWLILSFAAPVIGGALLQGGHVSVAGTFLGVVIVAIITQALVLFQIDPFIVQIVLGALILWAVGINRLREIGLSKGARAGA
jgi:ribose transport system permease protein